MTLSSSDLPLWCDSMRNTIAWVETHADHALTVGVAQLAVAPPEPSKDSGPVSGNPLTSPTERAVFTAAAEDNRDIKAVNELCESQTEIVAVLQRMYRDAGLLVGEIQKVQAATTPTAGATRVTETQCCERYCEDPATTRRRGRCEPCYRWGKRWSDEHGGEPPPGVPKAVIDARVAVRSGKTRIRVSGPDTGGFV